MHEACYPGYSDLGPAHYASNCLSQGVVDVQAVSEAVQAGECPDHCRIITIPLLNLPVALLGKIPVPDATPAVEAGAANLAPDE